MKYPKSLHQGKNEKNSIAEAIPFSLAPRCFLIGKHLGTPAFYIEDESGRKVQKEFVGTESKVETEAMLRKAIANYEEKKFVAKAENITVGDMLDMWVEEKLKPSSLSNGTVMVYMAAVKKIKKYPIGSRKLKTVTADHLQAFIDLMNYGEVNPDGTTSKPMSKGHMLQFSAVL